LDHEELIGEGNGVARLRACPVHVQCPQLWIEESSSTVAQAKVKLFTAEQNSFVLVLLSE